MRYRPSWVPEDAPADRGDGRPGWMRIKATAIPAAGRRCGAAASRHGSPAAGGVQHPIGPTPLGGGAYAGLAARLPPAAGPLRAVRRPTDRLPAPGPRVDLRS